MSRHALRWLATPLLSIAFRRWVAKVARRIEDGDIAAPLGGSTREREARRFRRERLGHPASHEVDGDTPTGPPTPTGPTGPAPAGRWLHAASVGEVITARPLLEALAARGEALLVTTATPSGAAVLQEARIPNLRHRYLPVDLAAPVARFLETERPTSGWIVETEIWPRLFAGCRAHRIPLSIVSARLSARTIEGPARWLRPVYRDALREVDVLARSEEDAVRYRALGAAPERVSVPGDLKRAAEAVSIVASDTAAATDGTARKTPVDATPIDGPFVDATGDRRYALAASTHDGEEMALARAWCASGTRTLLVIAPRHPERGAGLHAALLAALPSGERVARRALGEAPAAADRLYLADTLGELQAWYRGAAAAFVGGSLVPRGGHNLFEPARHACAIVTGPHLDNFREAADALLAADALQVVDDAERVVDFLVRACAHPAEFTARGRRAAAVAADDGGVLERYLAALGVDAGASVPE